ncbi:hypothetical protein BJY52DRAFT_1194184 [Lactarius psammicola]|nr:hypothetical protein BJY52DRAFT_1194184 [Lactarius psammicola]
MATTWPRYPYSEGEWSGQMGQARKPGRRILATSLPSPPSLSPHSIVSSNFTLSSNALQMSKTSAFSAQLKQALSRHPSLCPRHRSSLIRVEPQDESRIVIKGGPSIAYEDAEKARWKKAIDDHKQYASLFLCLISTDSQKYLQAFRADAPPSGNLACSQASPSDYLSGWLGALDDLARYRIVIAAMVPAAPRPSRTLTAAAVPSRLRTSPDGSAMSLSCTTSTASSENHPACPDSPSPSVGIVAARLMEIEPEKDRWRRVARDWYAEGVTGTPGHGKLHHHLGLLSREERARSCVVFVKTSPFV